MMANKYSPIFLFLVFSLIGAWRQIIVDFGGWSFYFSLHALFFALTVISVFVVLKKIHKSPILVSGQRHQYVNGDPLLFLRALFCLLVLLQHGFGITFQAESLGQHLFSEWVWLLLPSAWMGVWGFFVLSGYLMGKSFFTGAYPINKEGILGFYKNRLIKIVPGYFLVLALGGLLLEPEIFDYKNLWILASTALFDYDGALPLNPVGALWSIATEMQFYVICPIVALLIATLNFKKYSLAKNFIFLVLLFGIMMVYRLINFIDGGYYWKTAVMTPVVGNLDLFFGGMILSYILTRDRKNIFSVFIGLILSFMFYIFGAYVVSSIFIGKNWLWKIGYFGPTLTGLSVLLIITIFETNISEKLKNYLIIFIKKSSFFGLITYEIYLLHDPIQRLTRGLFPGELTLENSLLALLVSTLIIIPCAYVLNIFFETSFSKFRYKRNH